MTISSLRSTTPDTSSDSCALTFEIGRVFAKSLLKGVSNEVYLYALCRAIRSIVILAQAGIQKTHSRSLDSRLRGNDDLCTFAVGVEERLLHHLRGGTPALVLH